MSAQLTRVDLGRGSCDLGYLCGGACRAWGGEAAQRDLDAVPTECQGLHRRALRVLERARAFVAPIARKGVSAPCSGG